MNATRSANHRIPASAALSPQRLARENRQFAGTFGVSAGASDHGCVPGFLDTATGQTYRSRFANGSPAPVHVLDGLPDHLVEARLASGQVTSVRASVVCGFVSGGRFYTREEAKRCLA